MSEVELRQVDSESDIESAREIFREYEERLALDLCFQNFEDELKRLPGKYSPPSGRLYLARIGDDVAGCIAMRELEPGVCEMKRLFVREDFRGKQIGRMLIDKLLSDARDLGYRRMRLDTFPPKMGNAVRIYESYGFYQIAPYYNNPTEGVLFMELKLDQAIPDLADPAAD
jgi:putative acetyltransferase